MNAVFKKHLQLQLEQQEQKHGVDYDEDDLEGSARRNSNMADTIM